MKKVKLFLLTLVIGLTSTFYQAYKADFTTESIHKWILNGLLVAAIIGFIAVKYLKSKGKFD